MSHVAHCADRSAKSSCVNACQVKFTITQCTKATPCPTEIALQGSACPSTASGMCTNLTLCLMSHVSVLIAATAEGAIDHNMVFALECSVAVHRKECQSLGVCVLVCELCTMLLWCVATKKCSDTIGKAILKASLPSVHQRKCMMAGHRFVYKSTSQFEESTKLKGQDTFKKPQ